jgi:PilZ domain
MSPWRRARGPGETPLPAVERRHPRYLLNAPLMAIPETEEPQIGVQSYAMDISESGVGGLFEKSWDVGSRVKLEVSLPIDRTLLKVGAIVRHHTGVRYGFEFMEMSPEQRQIVRNVCRVLSTRKSVPGSDLR